MLINFWFFFSLNLFFVVEFKDAYFVVLCSIHQLLTSGVLVAFFAEILTGKPLFPGKNVVHQLDLMTDLLGTPSLDTVSRVCPSFHSYFSKVNCPQLSSNDPLATADSQ